MSEKEPKSEIELSDGVWREVVSPDVYDKKGQKKNTVAGQSHNTRTAEEKKDTYKKGGGTDSGQNYGNLDVDA